MNRNITFSVRESNALNKLPLGSTIIHFIETDLSYFREQCIELVYQYQNSGEYFPERASVLREYIRDCHPYCNILINTEFDKVVIDCIIDYLCERYAIGLEELWVKNLSASDNFGQAVFSRITEYKTGYAINQWINLLRMQKYAAAKMNFLFDGEEVSKAEYAARKLYFDMAFTLSAQELGCNAMELPQVRSYSVPLLPGSASLLVNAVNTLSPTIKFMTGGHKAKLPVKGRECLHDQAAAPAVNTIINLQRPMLPEIRQIMKTYENLPAEVYEPSCFKAIVDLEFDKLIEFGLLFQKSPSGNYIVADRSGNVPITETPESQEKEAGRARDYSEIPAETDSEKTAFAEGKALLEGKQATEMVSVTGEKVPTIEGETPASEKKIPTGISDGLTRIKRIHQMMEDPDRMLSKIRTPDEINQRCKLIWDDMSKQSGKNMTEEESREWFKSLVEIRYGIGTGKMTLEDLDRFFDATESVYRME